MEWRDASWGGAEVLFSGGRSSAEMLSGQRPEGGARGRCPRRSSRAVWRGRGEPRVGRETGEAGGQGPPPAWTGD